MSEWLCVEAIVRQRDREATAASIAKLSEASGKLKPVETEPEVNVMYIIATMKLFGNVVNVLKLL